MSDQNNEAANEEQGADEPVDPQAAGNRAAANEAGEGNPAEAEPDPFQVLVALQKENAELKDKALRAVAEAENTRRRAERERQDAVRYAAAGFARDMVQVSDNLRRAIAALKPEERDASPDTVKALIDGVEATERQLLSTFERHGIKEITPAPGDRFDAHLHEAMFEVPNSGQPAGSVVHVIEAGYTIGDRLLRAARVGVAKGEDGAPKGAGVDVRA
jgi:molecular chaperone GrpE